MNHLTTNFTGLIAKYSFSKPVLQPRVLVAPGLHHIGAPGLSSAPPFIPCKVQQRPASTTTTRRDDTGPTLYTAWLHTTGLPSYSPSNVPYLLRMLKYPRFRPEEGQEKEE